MLLRLFEDDARQQAAAVYGELMKQARAPWFFTVANVPDTLDGRFEVLVLHLYLYVCRLREAEEQEGADYSALEKALMQVLFDDMDQNLREMGVGDVGVPKKIKVMVEGVYGRFAAYDEALGDVKAIDAALRRNVYGTVEPAKIKADAVANLQQYLGVFIAHLQQLPTVRITHAMLDRMEPKELIKRYV